MLNSTNRLCRALTAIFLAGLVAAATAACGGDDANVSGGKCEVKVGKTRDVKPTIEIPDCATKPAGLVIRDVINGDGPEAKLGDTVTVQYVGVSWSTEKQFDASWDTGQSFDVTPLGQASVIKGWNKGLVGAKQGGRRLLVIPPGLGYGATGGGSEIKPNETLVFVVDIISVT